MSAQGRNDEGAAHRLGRVPAMLGALLSAATLLLPAPAVAAGRPPTIVGYLHSDPCVDVDLPYCTDPREATEPEHGTVLGHFTLSPATDPVRGQRMELAFELPAGLASGLYYLVVWREPCAAAGTTVDAAGATPLYVGVDPPPDGRPIRAWPLDDPAVAARGRTGLGRRGPGRKQVRHP